MARARERKTQQWIVLRISWSNRRRVIISFRIQCAANRFSRTFVKVRNLNKKISLFCVNSARKILAKAKENKIFVKKINRLNLSFFFYYSAIDFIKWKMSLFNYKALIFYINLNCQHWILFSFISNYHWTVCFFFEWKRKYFYVGTKQEKIIKEKHIFFKWKTKLVL